MTRLRTSCGSKSKRLTAAVRRESEALIVEIDDAFEHEIARGTPDATTAVAQLVDGTCVARGTGTFMYAYALELLCGHLGARLDAPVLQRTSPALLKLVDRVLRAHGVDAFKTRDLTDGRAPVRLPPRRSLPGIGALEPAVVALASRQIARVRVSELDVPTDDRGLRDATRRAIEEIVEWLAAALAMRGGGLVCFYY
jgi:hypothetical protein